MKGNGFTVFVMEDGSVRAKGKNNVGQLGNGTYTDSIGETRVKGINGVRAISIKEDHVVVVKKDNSVWVWGNHPLCDTKGCSNPKRIQQ